MAPDSNRSVPDLVGTVISQLSSLFRQEIQLARAEMSEKLGSVTSSIAPMAVGGAVLFGSMIMLLLALASLLMSFGLRAGVAYLAVGVIFALVGYLALRGGIAQLSATSLVPHRTAEQLSKDTQVMKEQVR